VPEGTYHVRFNAPQGYVASAMAGSTNLLTTPLTVGSGGSTAPIYVTLRDDFASLTCRVHTDQGTEAANPQKPLLVMGIPLDAPETRPQMMGMYAPTLRVGNTTIPPGRYLMVVADPARLQTLEYRNPEVLHELMSKGVTVTVAPGEKAQVEVPMMAVGDE